MLFVRHNGNPGSSRRVAISCYQKFPVTSRRPVYPGSSATSRSYRPTCEDPRCPPVIPFPPRNSPMSRAVLIRFTGRTTLEVHLRPLGPAHRDRADMVPGCTGGRQAGHRGAGPGSRISPFAMRAPPFLLKKVISLISPPVGRCSDQYMPYEGPQQMASHPGVKSSRSRPQTGQAPRARRSFSEGCWCTGGYSLDHFLVLVRFLLEGDKGGDGGVKV